MGIESVIRMAQGRQKLFLRELPGGQRVFLFPWGGKKKRKKETGISNFTSEQKALTFTAMQFVKALPGPISKMCCKELWENCCHTILHKELSYNL